MSTQPIGLDAALSRIEQIQTYQQQLLDPSLAATASSAAATSAASSLGSSTSGSSTSSSSASATDFASLLSALQTQDAAESDAIGVDADSGDAASTDPSLLSSLTGGTSTDSLLASLLAGVSGQSAGTATGTVTGTNGIDAGTGASAPGGTGLSSSDSSLPIAVQNMTTEANSLIGQPYVWGGGHSGWGTQSGYDCSGFVSAVLHAGGYLSSPQDTTTLPQAAGIESGPGQYVTIYDRTDGYDGQEGHVIIDLDGQFYESGGQAGAWGGGGGVEKISRPSAAYLATFNDILHPSGL